MKYYDIGLISLLIVGTAFAQTLPLHLARLLDSAGQKPADPPSTPLCDPTLSFIEVYYTIPSHPEYGGSMFIYQQVDCATYNMSLYFLSNEQPRFASWTLKSVALPETPGSYAGTSWSEGIRMELSIDPLDWTRERWFWSADGSSLIREVTYDHMSLKKTANGTTESYTWHSSSEIWSSLSSSLVLKRIASFTRRYQVPAPIGVAPQDAVKLESHFDTLKLNKTGSPANVFKF
eukprot:TRINITY_DN3529_c0_g4_i1.p1 TRINITY_DN3529_c0_g4~~TRINITY_DN3529_c0_g4_i1.p1  ORF type:complete len:233 (-),score=24.57 TRINITY_DN3529_c0_g4_i1:42-740(-)